MELQEWINIGITNGVVTMDPIQEVTFEEVYKKWFLMKMNVVKAPTCDRIECTYNRFYKNSWLATVHVSKIDENTIIRFLTGIVVGHGVTQREFGRILQVVNNVLVYAWDLKIGGGRLLDWNRIRRYIPEGKFVPDLKQDFAVPKADVEKMLHMVIDQDIYPIKRSACLCLLLNFFLGLRVGELAALTWQDIDLTRKVVRVYKTETKCYERDETGARNGAMVYRVMDDVKTIYSVREVPLLPEAIYILQKLKEHHEASHYENKSLAYDGKDTIIVRSLDRTLRKLCQYCEVSYFNTHMIRKTFATMLHTSGMPTRFISDLLGHSEMVTTERNYILTYQDNFNALLGYMHKGLNFEL